MTGQCLDRDISIVPNKNFVTVRFAGRVVARSSRAKNLYEPGHPVRIYVPRADVDAASLQPSSHTSHCPFKGEASYHHLEVNGAIAENAVWFYPDPCPLVAAIRDHLAFRGDGVAIMEEER